MIVLDASVLIAHFQATDVHHDRATRLLLDVADEQLAASPLTLAAVLVGPARAGKMAQAQSALRDLGVTAIPVDEDAHSRLASLRADTGLRLPDCCVLLAAASVQAAFATFDQRLAAAATGLGHAVRS